MNKTPFWGWPGWTLIGRALLLSLAVMAWFLAIYIGADYVTSLHPHRVRIHFDWELGIPFVPSMVLGYMSMYPLFWMSPFVLRRKEELDALALTLMAVILVGGICFLLLPSESAFPSEKDAGAWSGLYRTARDLALRHNMVPSLHVALTCVCVAIYADRAGILGKSILWSWACFLATSTMLIHQHHLVDVVTGFTLALIAKSLIFDRRVRPASSQAGQIPEANPKPDRERPA